MNQNIESGKTVSNTPNNKTFGVIRTEEFVIDISGAQAYGTIDLKACARFNEAEKFNLDYLVSQNVIKKTENFPSAGYTTFAI